MLDSLLLGTFVASSFLPGLLIVRRWRVGRLETVAYSIAVSVLIQYSVSFAAYLAAQPGMAPVVLGVTCLVALIAARHELLALGRDPAVQRLACGFVLLLLWTLGLLALVRNLDGADWSSDWLEHYQRVKFFAERQPLETLFIGRYVLPARPPLQNVVTAAFLAPVGVSFASHQLISAFLGCLVYVPAYLLAQHFSAGTRPRPAVLTLLLMLNPLFVQNATYGWTKLLAAFYVLIALHAYVRSPFAPRLCLVALACGILTHYSAAPYALVLGGHYAYSVLRGHRALRPLLSGASLAGLILLSWVAWSVANYGLATTVASNTTVTESRGLSHLENAGKVVRNIWWTVVPFAIRGESLALFQQENEWGCLRDFTFLLYQANIVFAFGVVGWSFLLFHLRAGWKGARQERAFWLGFVTASFLLGVAVVGDPRPFGAAHVCLQALVILGLAFLSSRPGGLPSEHRVWVLAGLAIDGAWILLHFTIQHHSFALVRTAAGRLLVDTVDGFGGRTYVNFLEKSREGLIFLGDLAAPAAPAIVVGLLGILTLTLAWVRREAAPSSRSVIG